VGPEHRFKLGGSHLVRFVLDDLLHPVHDVQVAVGIGVADIAGVEPAVGLDGVGRRLGLVQVAEHHLGAAHQHLAGLARLDFLASRQVHDLALGARHQRPD
jgi:hypothetical protein